MTNLELATTDDSATTKINATVKNRKILRQHAREALASYSRCMTWLLLGDDGDLSILREPQGQTRYVGSDIIIDKTGDCYKAHGKGAATDSMGNRYKTLAEFYIDLLGRRDYQRIFVK